MKRAIWIAAALGVTAATVQAQLTLLHTFTGTGSDGANPMGTLTLSGGTLYGMTFSGGTSGGGTVFDIGTNGSGYTTLRSFTGGSDGLQPSGSLTLSGGTLYGMTTYGGASFNGNVFQIGTNGSGYANLYTFTGGNGGAKPSGSLTLSGATLYGMTTYGGSNSKGNVFQIGTGGSYANLHSFTNEVLSSATPLGSLTLSGSFLYGMGYGGGASGQGTVFRIGTNGSGYTALYSFTGGSDGAAPKGSLTLAGDGATLYGLTSGGTSSNGTVFAIGTNGTFTLLHTFTGNDGAAPGGDLTLSPDGSTLYGLTSRGGASSSGTVFRVGTSGSGFTTLYSFTGGSDGASPAGSLTLSGNGTTLYGETSAGGTSGKGTIFSLSAIPEPGTIGLLVLLGSGLIGWRRLRSWGP